MSGVVLSDEFYDAYGETIPGQICDCPACNHYALDYEQHQGKPCASDDIIRAEVARQIAAALRNAASEIAGSFPYNGELLPDGREDPIAASYVEGLRDAHAIVTALAGPGKCGECGRNPATGFASTWTAAQGEIWLCHGDDDTEPTCYQRAHHAPAIREEA